jgi:bacteriocin-like protein
MMSNAVKEENATANGQEARELTEHELNTVAGGNWNIPEGTASPSSRSSKIAATGGGQI